MTTQRKKVNYLNNKNILQEIQKSKMTYCWYMDDESTMYDLIVHSLDELTEDKIDEDNLLQYIIPSDLKSFGLIPEIIGRLPVLSYMNPLDARTLRLILTEPKNSIIKQYEKLFAMDDVKFEIKDEALQYIVDKAVEYKLGARGLRSLCEAILTDAMFELPSSDEKEFIVTKDYAEGKLTKTTLKKLRAAS